MIARANWTCGCEAVNAWTARFCERCGAERPGPRPLEVAPRAAPQQGNGPPPSDTEVKAFMAEIRRRLGVDLVADARLEMPATLPGEMTRGPLVVKISTEPICAWCEKPAADYVLQDARLWHRPCWRMRKARHKAERFRRRASEE